MSEPSPTSTLVVPPYLNEHWRKLRTHLQEAVDSAEAAASSSTTEKVRPLLGQALNSLMDASFQLALIERDGDVAIIEDDEL